MFLLRRPTRARMLRYLESERASAFSYTEHLATLGTMPSRGYVVDTYGTRLGEGERVFDAARRALMRFANYPARWTTVVTDGDREPHAGLVFVTHVAHFGFHSLNSCRVHLVIDEREPHRRYGFVFGTLTGHEERGEESFVVSLDPVTNEVRYDVRAFSRPRGPLARLGAPLARSLQRRFHVDTCAAMRSAVRDA